MRTRAFTQILIGVCVLSLLAGYWYFCHSMLAWHTLSDPDRFFHFAIARDWVRLGHPPAALPQISDLSWSIRFTDKEFLYHALIAPFFGLWGERGVELAQLSLGVVILGLLLSSFWRTLRVRDRFSVFLLIGGATLLLTHAYWIKRMLLIRPHVLAVLILIGLVLSARNRSKAGVFIAGVAFVLAYHAFYIPLLFFGFLLGVGLFLRDALTCRLAGVGCLGVFLGLALHPHEHVFQITLMAADIARGRFSHLDLGSELKPLPALEWVQLTWFSWVAVGSALLYTLYHRKERSAFEIALAFFWVSLGLLSFQSIRVLEYWLPISVLMLACEVSQEKFGWGARGIAVMLLLLGGGIGALNLQFEITHPLPLVQRSEELERILYRIPRTEGQKVLNCEWGSGSQILYQRPDLRFVDLLDPNFLALDAPEKHILRKRLLQGERVRVQELKEGFKANWVLCRSSVAVQTLLSQSGVILVDQTRDRHPLFSYSLLQLQDEDHSPR